MVDYSIKIVDLFDGIVLDVKDGYFTARLASLLNEQPELIVEISLDNVRDKDRNQVIEGALFYWPVGSSVLYCLGLDVSAIRFRDLPGLTTAEIQNTKSSIERFDFLFEEI